MRNRLFYLTAFSFLGGVIWRSFLPFHPSLTWIVSLLAFFLTTIFLGLKRKTAACLAIIVLSFVLGIWRFQMADISPPAFFEAHVGKSITVTGLIDEEPAKSATGVKLIVRTVKGNDKVGMVIFPKKDTGLAYGDQIQITGILEKPTNFMTDQGLEFDYINYLRKDGIFYTMRDPTVKMISSDQGNWIKRIVLAFKVKLLGAIEKGMQVPASTLMEGLILGERSALSGELRQSFMDTGTVHLVTIGGYHVALVSEWILAILQFLPTVLAAGAGLAGICLYVLLTGGSQTTIRAGIMAGLALLAKLTGRTYSATGHDVRVLNRVGRFVLARARSRARFCGASVAQLFRQGDPFFIATSFCSPHDFQLPVIIDSGHLFGLCADLPFRLSEKISG